MGSQTDSKRIDKGKVKDDIYPLSIPYLSVSYRFAIRYLSFYDPIIYLSILGFQLCYHTLKTNSFQSFETDITATKQTATKAPKQLQNSYLNFETNRYHSL